MPELRQTGSPVNLWAALMADARDRAAIYVDNPLVFDRFTEGLDRAEAEGLLTARQRDLPRSSWVTNNPNATITVSRSNVVAVVVEGVKPIPRPNSHRPTR